MGLHIFLTGEPKAGKSTILRETIQGIAQKTGFLTAEMTKDGRRYGFKTIAENGSEAILALDSDETLYPVGRFFVQVEGYSAFMESLPVPTINDVIYVDEIGQMQLLSKKFIDAVTSYLSMPNMLIGTISKVYDHPYIQKAKNSPATAVIEVTPENRNQVRKTMKAVVDHHRLMDNLSTAQYALFIQFVESANHNPIRLYKLFHNTLPYVVEGSVRKTKDNQYAVKGLTNTHTVTKTASSTFACDCDLFLGTGQYSHNNDTCSHIFAALLFEAS